MRHGNKLNHLGRKSAHRKAMISNMACSLIQNKRISTTLAKAKALRVFVEPLLTKSKSDSTHSRRVVFSYLQNKEIVTELFREIAPKIADRSGGYTRIIRTGYRLGDNAEMCLIELVDFNEVYNTDRVKKTTRRSRRGGSSKAAASPELVTDETAVVEDAVVVEDASVIETSDTSEETLEIETAPEAAVEEEVVAAEETSEVETVPEAVVEEEEVAVEETPEVESVPEPAVEEETPAEAVQEDAITDEAADSDNEAKSSDSTEEESKE